MGQISNKPIYIDNPNNIKAAIELGSYDSRIKEMLPKGSLLNESSKFSYIVENPKRTDVIKVSTDNTSKEQAVSILTALMQLLKEDYHQKSELFKSGFQLELETLQSEINQGQMEISRRENYINRTEAIIEELSKDVKSLDQYSAKLSEGKTKVSPPGNDRIDELIYKDFKITQNLAMIRDLKETIRNHQFNRNNEIEKLQGLNSNLRVLKNKINQLQNSMNSIQNIQALQSPEVDSDPVKPRKTRNFIIVLLAGLCLSTIFVFIKQAIQTNQP